jgi:serine/threonine-protein kinase RsbW
VIREPARVRLELESHPENVALVRAALTGVVEAADLGEEFAADLKTAVSEACNNVALHAYDESGPMFVEIAVAHDGISVIVGDRGKGIKRIDSAEDRMGLGLAVISALADKAEFASPGGGGTEVRMWFSLQTLIPAPSTPTAELEAELAVEQMRSTAELSGDLVAWLSPVELSRFVLGRVFRTLAATSHFSITGVQELQAVNDAVAGYAELAADGTLGISISSSSRKLVMTGGPFSREYVADEQRLDAGEESQLQNRRRALARVVDEFNSERLNGAELLHFVLVDSRRDAAVEPDFGDNDDPKPGERG